MQSPKRDNRNGKNGSADGSGRDRRHLNPSSPSSHRGPKSHSSPKSAAQNPGRHHGDGHAAKATSQPSAPVNSFAAAPVPEKNAWGSGVIPGITKPGPGGGERAYSETNNTQSATGSLVTQKADPPAASAEPSPAAVKSKTSSHQHECEPRPAAAPEGKLMQSATLCAESPEFVPPGLSETTLPGHVRASGSSSVAQAAAAEPNAHAATDASAAQMSSAGDAAESAASGLSSVVPSSQPSMVPSTRQVNAWGAPAWGPGSRDGAGSKPATGRAQGANSAQEAPAVAENVSSTHSVAQASVPPTEVAKDAPSEIIPPPPIAESCEQDEAPAQPAGGGMFHVFWHILYMKGICSGCMRLKHQKLQTERRRAQPGV